MEVETIVISDDEETEFTTSREMDLKMNSTEDQYTCISMPEKEEPLALETPALCHPDESCNQFPAALNGYNITDFVPNIPDFIFEPLYYYTNEELSKNETETENVIDLSMKTDNQKCSPSQVHESAIESQNKNDSLANDSLESQSESFKNDKSDSDDDVVFIKEYKNVKNDNETFTEEIRNDDSNVRRNPKRMVRNKSKNLSHELLYEEDFVFFNSTDDDIEEKENKNTKRLSASKLPKEWPPNVHERPEYNPDTKTVEAFDYTIREIQNTSASSSFELPKNTKKNQPPAQKDIKKKGKARKSRKTASPVRARETVSLDSLKPLINSTTDLLKQYFLSTKDNRDIIKTESPICTFDNKVEILRNQAFLYAIVNNMDEKQVTDNFKNLDLQSNRKS